ncbi:MAG TPA: membrane protein insertion efficiency factor YidD [Candidatus Binatia bacterium]|nr:membrane protein insertion efficiency factor YidD [Candidatus Binatia bacterium]
MNQIISKLLGLFLFGYRNVLSPLLPQACRFYPTCSAYAEQAIEKHGVVKGIFFGLKRIARCHPGSGGGYDPVN